MVYVLPALKIKSFMNTCTCNLNFEEKDIIPYHAHNPMKVAAWPVKFYFKFQW